MDFLNTLGFDPIMLGAQILNFLIIFYLLKRFLYKPVMDMIKKREDIIKTGLRQAEEAAAALENATAKEKKVLEEANLLAKKIVEDAKNQGLQLSKKMEDNARQHGERMISDVRSQMTQEANELEKRLTEKVSLLAQGMLTKSLSGMIGQKEQKTIIKRGLKNLKRVD